MTNELTPSRRRFLQALGGCAFLSLPSVTLPGFVQAAGAAPPAGNILVLVELAGGNDGLNTVVPTRDAAYRALRPEIGIARRNTLGLDRRTGLHPSMTEVAALWQDGELRIVEGVGYPSPNRSHFRSIEIWNSGRGADSLDRQGWVSAAFATGGPDRSDADGLVLGGAMGPLAGPGRFSAMRDEELFFETQANLPGGGHQVRPAAASPLAHVLRTYDSAQITGAAILKRLEASPARRFPFPDTELGQQLRTAARLLDAGVETAVLKVVQDGYDTHEAQPDTHSGLLRDLSASLGAFAAALRRIGLWEKVTVVTYSEFGRTAHENASGGTDHGAAAPVLVAGGSVEGGLAGGRPSLERVADGDLEYTTDYRRVYEAILRDLWGIDAGLAGGPGTPLRLLAA
ncbi:MAG: DUF1501 domain-containing protein [Rhodobacter sp.]|nr:DUF1501 domain-containing protein [Rhodobacter sp.]